MNSLLANYVEKQYHNCPNYRVQWWAQSLKGESIQTIYVKFDPTDTTQVAVDHAPIEALKANAVKCPSCGAAPTLAEGQATCSYCGSPLTT